MEESDCSNDLIDFSSENDNLIFSNHLKSPETQNEARSFEFFGDMDADKVVDKAHTSGCNEQSPLLIEMAEPEQTRKNSKCNLRKSLAWDSAFFTSSGVLDPEELSSMIEGAGKAKRHALHGIEEDFCKSTDSISTMASDNLTLETIEAELFEDIRASIQKSSKAFNIANSSSKSALGETITQALPSSKLADLACQNKLKPKPAPRMTTIGMQRSGKTMKKGSSGPQFTQLMKPVAKIGDSVPSLSRLPKVINRANPLPAVATKRASMGTSRVKIENDIAKITLGGNKGTQASKVTGLTGPRRAVPKPVIPFKPSSIGSSTTTNTSTRSLKPSFTGARGKIDPKTVNPPSSGLIPKASPKIAMRNKTPSEISDISAHLMSSNLSSSISPASSISEWSLESSSSTSTVNQKCLSRASHDTYSSTRSFDSNAPPALGLNIHSSDQVSRGNKNQARGGIPSQNIKKASAQVDAFPQTPSVKPSGLRMPSPKIGFFDGAKSVLHTPNGGMQSQSRLSIGLPKFGVGLSSPIVNSSKAKVGKLPPAITPPAIWNIKPDTQRYASPKKFREPSIPSIKVEKKTVGENNENLDILADICDSNSDNCVEYKNPSKGVNGKNNLIGSINVNKNGHFGDQVDGLGRNVGLVDSQVENEKCELSCSDCGGSEISFQEQFVENQKEESSSDTFTFSTRPPFAVKNSYEGFEFSTESSIEVVKKTATLPPSEIGQKENS